MITLTIQGKPVPAQRMTQKSKWSKRSRRSLDYQEHVARVAGLFIKDKPLPWKYVAVEMKFFIKARSDGELPGNRPDLDNLCKAVLDGLQYGNVFANDRCVVEAHLSLFPCESLTDERVELTIREA